MVNPLLPRAGGLRCNRIQIDGGFVTITVESMARMCPCPVCGRAARRVHSRYTRKLADLPWQGSTVRWRLLSRKLFCDTPCCPRRILVERLPDVAPPYARNTGRLDAALSCIAFACGGEGGARLADDLGMPISPDTLLRRIRSSPSRCFTTPRVLGIDDWAKRKGQRYGTILCDLEQHRPIDMLDDRAAETLVSWLRAHPGVEVITRDRAGFYARGASDGAPQAIQVADRFHLMQNLRDALVRMLERRHRQLVVAAREIAAVRDTTASTPTVDPPPDIPTRAPPHRSTQSEARRSRRLERYQKVIELHGTGISQRHIARQLGINRGTVGRYLRVGTFPERAPRKYARKVDPFADYLRRRWREGCHNAARLAQELRDRGFVGSYCSVRRYVAGWNRAGASNSDGTFPLQPRLVHPPSVNRLAWTLLKQAEAHDDDERMFTEALFQRCPELDHAASLAREFHELARDRRSDVLDDWIERATDQAVPRELRVFAQGLTSDYSAVKAAFTADWSNGQVEGQVNRLKLIKRQMYGRAKFDLLRKRVLHAG